MYGDYDEEFSDDNSATTDAMDSTPERIVWLFGSGFSKALGGPLFTELVGQQSARWVSGWLRWKGFDAKASSRYDVVLARYLDGIRAGVWSNPEECLALLNEAREDSLTRTVISRALPANLDSEGEQSWSLLSQFVAIATSFFVDRVQERPELPEAWIPYQDWIRTLTVDDTIISFNYDRVVEELFRRSGGPGLGRLIKLHGTVPDSKELVELVRKELPVTSIATPGPGKVLSTKGPFAAQWQDAGTALLGAQRLIVIGYSFPASDPAALSFILKHCKESLSVTIALGAGEASQLVDDMFARRLYPGRVRNTGLLGEQFLAEGSARLSAKGRFNIEMFHP